MNDDNSVEARVWASLLKLLSEDGSSELTINGPSSYFVTKKGKRHEIKNIPKLSEKAFMRSIEIGLVPYIKSTIDFKDANHLFEGSIEVPELGLRGRATIILPPSSTEPVIVITKRDSNLTRLTDIANSGSMSSEMYDFIEAAVQANCTIVVSGGTGSGKTTLTEAIVGLMPSDSRIGVAEDVPELLLPQKNVSYLNSVPVYPGMEAGSNPDLQWIVAQCQRLRLDKIVIGETRGKEFSDFLVAANSGLEGSITTIHANNPKSCLEKMANFAQKGSPSHPIRMINKEIGSTIDFVIQLKRFNDGRYRTTHIEHVTNITGRGEDAPLSSSTLYRYNYEDDTFIKSSPIPDEIRNKFQEHNIEFNRFSSNPVNRKSNAYSQDFFNRDSNESQQYKKPPMKNPLRRS